MSLFTKGTSVVGGLAGLGAGIAQNFFGSKRDGMQSPYNVSKFASRIAEINGLYKPSLYLIQIIPRDLHKWWGVKNARPPAPISDAESKDMGMMETNPLALLCNSAALPGVQILTSDHRRHNMGTFDRRPFGVQVTDIPLTFMVDNDGITLRFFNKWMNNIARYQGDNYLSEREDDRSPAMINEISFRDRYLSTITITCLDGTAGEDTATKITKYTLYEAFPIQMGDLTVAWAETDSFLSLPIQFTFKSYEMERIENERAMATKEFSLTELLGLISGAAGVIGGLKGASKQSILTNGISVLNNKQTIGKFVNF